MNWLSVRRRWKESLALMTGCHGNQHGIVLDRFVLKRCLKTHLNVFSRWMPRWENVAVKRILTNFTIFLVLDRFHGFGRTITLLSQTVKGGDSATDLMFSGGITRLR